MSRNFLFYGTLRGYQRREWSGTSVALFETSEKPGAKAEVKRKDKIDRFWIASALRCATQTYLLFPVGDIAIDAAYRLPGFEEVLKSVYYFGQKRFDRGAATFRLSPELDARVFPRRREDGTTNTRH